MGPPQGRAEGKENLPRPAGHTLLNAPQDPISFLGNQSTLLAHGQLVVHQDTARMARMCAVVQQGREQGHGWSGAGRAANSHLTARGVVPAPRRASRRLKERGSACRDLSACPWAKHIFALVQQTLWPRADGGGCGFPLSPPFLLAGARGWGELCVAHCGRVSPLGITFWRGDPRRE